MAPVSLKKTIQSYKTVAQQLETKLDQLTQKKNEIESRGFVVLDEHSVEVLPSRQTDIIVVEKPQRHTTTAVTLQQKTSPTVLKEELETQYPSNISSLVATATNILIESISLRLSYVQEAIKKLMGMYHENPKLPTPPELLFSRYEEWVATNQKLFELNTRLYDLEKLKFDLKEKKRLAKKAIKKLKTEGDRNITGSQFVQSSVERIQSFLSRFHQHSSSFSNTTQLFLQELLSPRGERQTLEATKIQEYVNECLQAANKDDGAVIGAHPERYHEFIEVLCNYIVEKQRDLQGVELAHEMVYSTIERFLVPKIQSAILKFVAVPERDAALQKQCERFRDVTLQQLGVKASLIVNHEVVPFIESISQLRASYFSPTPTDKMYSVVEAARALYEQLNSIGESSIDGDSFLDLWIYVIIKANVKDLATNLQLMIQYGNQRLANDEVGYYLTTLEAAVIYVENLSPRRLKGPTSTQHFVVCERYKFQRLSRLPSSCFEVITECTQLHGYRMVTIKEWALNRARIYSTVLVPTGDSNDIAVVAIIRLISNKHDTTHLEYFNQHLLHPEEDYAPLYCQQTNLGIAVVMNPSKIDPHKVIVLPNGDFETHFTKLNHVLHLVRLGSETREMTCTTADIETSTLGVHERTLNDSYVYVYTPPDDPFTRNLDSIKSTASQPASRSSAKSKPIASTKKRAASARHEPGDFLLASSPYLLSYSMETLPPEGSLSSKPNEKRSRKRNWSLNLRKKISKEGRDNHGEYAPVRLVSSQRPHSNSTSYDETRHKAYNLYSRDSRNRHYHDDRDSESETDDNPPNTVQVQVEVHDFDDNSHLTMKTKSFERKSGNSSKREFDMKSFVEDSGNHLSPSRHDSDVTMSQLNQIHVPTEDLESVIHEPDGTTRLVTNSTGNSVPLSAGDEDLLGEQANMFCSLPRGFELGETDGALSEKSIANLEANFRKNHLLADDRECLDEEMCTIIKRAQMFLQRLNYLSLSSPIDGQYSDVTLDAVKRFQVSHNVYEPKSAIKLPTNGYLTAATFQYLRQAFLTMFASLMRVGLDKYLTESFNPVSTSDEDIAAFIESVAQFQEANNLSGQCQDGVVCPTTVERVRQILHSQRIAQ